MRLFRTRKELSGIEKQFADIHDSREAIFREIRESEEQEKQNEARIETAQARLAELKQSEAESIDDNEKAHLKLAALTQKRALWMKTRPVLSGSL